MSRKHIEKNPNAALVASDDFQASMAICRQSVACRLGKVARWIRFAEARAKTANQPEVNAALSDCRGELDMAIRELGNWFEMYDEGISG